MSDEQSARSDRRRTRGIFERPKGSGIWWVRYHDQFGREHREKVGPKKLAGDVYRKRKTEIAEQRFFPEKFRRPRVLLADAITDYLGRNASRIRSFKEWSRVAHKWSEAPETKGKTLDEVRPADIERYRERRRQDGAAEATVNRELTCLRAVYRTAITDGKVERSPVLPRFFFRERNQRVRQLSDEEETALRAAVPARHLPKLDVALYTGFRRGNVLGLRWEDVNFASGLVWARSTKSGEDYAVPMNDALRATLQALPSRMRSVWVFPDRTGEQPVDGKRFDEKVFRPAVRRAGILDFRFHDLRHTFGSRLVQAGVHIRTVQELLGHKSLRMTERYTHLAPSQKADAVQALVRTGTPTGTGPEGGEKTQTARAVSGEGVLLVKANRRAHAAITRAAGKAASGMPSGPPPRALSATRRPASGRQRRAFVGPKRTTPAAPSAPASWLTPLSLPR